MDQIEQTISELEKQIEVLAESAEYDYDKGDHYKSRSQQLLKTIDDLLIDENQLTKKHRVELHYLKGKVFDIVPEYSKQAEESLTRAMKLNPYHSESLNTLGHILWKKRDFQAAKQCFETVTEKDPNNLKALQYLSIVLRQVGEPKDKAANYNRSVEIAKKALMLNLENAQSWYLAGNAYMSNYFTNPKKGNNELKMALSAYNKSESFQKRENPDLYYNRGNILCYFEDYQSAFQDYRKANQIDKSLVLDRLKEVEQKVYFAYDLITNRCRITQKKLQNIVKQIPVGLKHQPQGFNQKMTMCPLIELNEGENKDKILACKSLKNYTNAQTIPAGFVIMDCKMNFAALSIYHISQEIYEKVRENTELYIIEPVVKLVVCTINDQVVSYPTIQVTDVDKFYVENQKIVNQFAPSQVVNQTFEK